jgi:hypothetical protein
MAKDIRKNSWWGETRPIMKRVNKEVWLEFENVCEEIGVEEHVMLNEVMKEFCKEMRFAQKHRKKTVYGDLFPNYVNDFNKK